MAWQKGQSGNPSGHVAKRAAMLRRLEGLTFKAVDVLEEILLDKTATHSERLSAAKEVFDRAIGKAKQQATIEVTHNASPHLSALIGLATMTTIEGSLVDPVVHSLTDQSANVLISLDELDVDVASSSNG
jgi:DNA replication initiation complex subunit (GINS family)